MPVNFSMCASKIQGSEISPEFTGELADRPASKSREGGEAPKFSRALC